MLWLLAVWPVPAATIWSCDPAPHVSSVVITTPAAVTPLVAVQFGYDPEIAQHSFVLLLKIQLSALAAVVLGVTSLHVGGLFPAVAAYCAQIDPMLELPAFAPPVLPRLSSSVTTTTATTIAPPISNRYSSAPCPLFMRLFRGAEYLKLLN